MLATDDTDSNSSHVAERGNWGYVEYGRLEDGSSPAKDFVEALAIKDKAKLVHLFKQLANTGRISNKEKFRHEGGKIFSFKVGQIRIACYQSGNRWILTHGFNKKRDRWPPPELERAETLMYRINELRGGA